MPKQSISVETGLSVERFRSEYFHTKTPVIIRGLFDDSPIAHVSDESSAINLFGDYELETLEEYVSKFQRDDSFVQPTQRWAFRRYLEHVKAHPATKICVREYDTPKGILDLFRVPDLCRVRPDSAVTSNLFLANASNAAQMHFDGDHRHVLLYQVFGRKRVFLVPCTSSVKLFPVLNQSWCNFQQLSDQEKSEFIAYVGGYEYLLQPGETLYFPMMMWHHMEYVDTGMSVNFRFGRSRYSDFLYKFMHADKYVQNIASVLDFDKPPHGVDADACFERIQNALKEFCPDPREKFRAMRALMKQLYQEVCLDAANCDYFIGGEDEIIAASKALSALTAQPYHVSNWLRLHGLHSMMLEVINDVRASSGKQLALNVKGVTAKL